MYYDIVFPEIVACNSKVLSGNEWLNPFKCRFCRLPYEFLLRQEISWGGGKPGASSKYSLFVNCIIRVAHLLLLVWFKFLLLFYFILLWWIKMKLFVGEMIWCCQTAFLGTVKHCRSHFWKFEWWLGLVYNNEPPSPLPCFKASSAQRSCSN